MLTLSRRKFIMQIFHDMKFDLIITLTYVLMDKFCPLLGQKPVIFTLKFSTPQIARDSD